ncbi:uncharacterized protein LOC116262239 [Nymphaea colorata]|nr:uncharacterized protein LOC116262239 [Nymphaea colorata]
MAKEEGKTVLNEDLWLVEGQQERMINGPNVWNWPVAYDKLGARTIAVQSISSQEGNLNLKISVPQGYHFSKVNEAKNVLKLCDFGYAMFAGKNEITPYCFYCNFENLLRVQIKVLLCVMCMLLNRDVRVIIDWFLETAVLGLPYDHALDIWSVGCCLYELYTGKVLFPGPSNNGMLRLHMELKGPFHKKMLRKAVKRLLVNIKANDFSSLISSYTGEDPKMLANFIDLLDRIFVLDPEKRLTVSQALSHPFITGK